MDSAAAEAFIHRRAPLVPGLLGYSGHVVCGVRLFPFALAHSFLLEAVGSPLLRQPESILTAPMAELVRAAAICARRPRAPRSSVNPPRLGFGARVRADFYARAPFDLAERQKWVAYLRDYCAEPQHWRERKSRAVKTPWQFYRAGLLQKLCGWSRARAWACPVGESAWRIAIATELEGQDPKIVTESERALFAAAGYPQT